MLRSLVGSEMCIRDRQGEPRIVLDEAYGQAPGEDHAPGLNRLEESGGQGGNGDGPGRQVMEGLKGRYVGKTVVVTGGSKGIGEGCSRVFFAAGANVVVSARGEKDGLALINELNSHASEGNRAIFVKADVSKVDQVQALIDAAVAEFGQLDCLINNAGWHPPPKSIDDFTVDEMQDLFQLNFVSIFAACKYALPHLRKVKGNIINMSSWVGANGQAQAPTYTATKGAITAFSKSLAIDEAASGCGVRVNIVSPGNIWTPLWKSWSDGEADPEAAREAGDRVQVMGRKGTIVETGRLCLCIAADMTFTTGVDHIQSGGAELGYGVKA
eukprot:TRINITY_DN49340_c0_g1_i1.p1 TRINITY_DN49340_c0_g1~~TRINITY_DN49340_c0_g1_i1.p1  ORF type:complete len:327 (+),score=86.78 TRINITY_DN49340_c0_g1_i1:164-1144(+)